MTTRYIAAAIAALLIYGTAQAATLGFTDTASNVTGLVAAPAPFESSNVVERQVASGVTFIIEGFAFGVNRIVRSRDGLEFGRGGNGMTAVNITTNTDIRFNGFVGRDEFGFGFDELEFSTGILGKARIPGSYGFSSPFDMYVAFNAPIEVDAGETFQLFFTTAPGLNEADILSLQFDVLETPPIPLPAGLPLLAGGFGLLAWMRRKS